MNAEEAVAGYNRIRSQLDAGQVTLDAYNQMIAELRYQDNAGTWWAISPQDGSWLKWTGHAWVTAFEQAARAVPQPPGQASWEDPASPSGYIPPVTGRQDLASSAEADAGEARAAVARVTGEQPGQSPAFMPSYYRYGSEEDTARTGSVARPAATSDGKQARFLTAIGSLLLGILAWVVFPYILGILATAGGGYSLFLSRKDPGAIALVALCAIFIALAAMVVEYLVFSAV